MNMEPSQSNNTIFGCRDPNQSNKPIKDESMEAKTLVEMERWIEQEGPKKEVWVGRQMPLDLRQSLIELLKEYADIFTWSYRDMPGLDREIMEHKLPILPNLVSIRQ
ncbi:hypothetical protein CR513_56610, partial [Mucuna pruriens]